MTHEEVRLSPTSDQLDALVQAEKRQDNEDDNDCADEVDDAVHDIALVLVKGSKCVLSTSHHTPIPTVRHSIRNIRTLTRIRFETSKRRQAQPLSPRRPPGNRVQKRLEITKM